MNSSIPKTNFGPKQSPGKAAGPFLALAIAILIILSGGCASPGGSAGNNAGELTLAPLSQMPDYVQSASPNVQEAYRFAVANPESLDHIPCYCGCGGMGHGNNLDCYVAAFNSEGSVAQFESHATY